ncbi:protein of unknown function [[Clostridium] ultunense Esp]|uniref:Uncharacterized protein n=1 Tax=[Clostridium] ultunense Esp TaxID=1288971 RepID=A0A1M4PQT6_9FIRM|nr:protein of unknown function [[Clostridium] ultunense Esp]
MVDTVVLKLILSILYLSYPDNSSPKVIHIDSNRPSLLVGFFTRFTTLPSSIITPSILVPPISRPTINFNPSPFLTLLSNSIISLLGCEYQVITKLYTNPFYVFDMNNIYLFVNVNCRI